MSICCLRTKRSVGRWFNVGKDEANSPLNSDSCARRKFSLKVVFELGTAIPSSSVVLYAATLMLSFSGKKLQTPAYFLYSMKKEEGVKAQFCHLETANRLDKV